jgi:hypothetical protein
MNIPLSEFNHIITQILSLSGKDTNESIECVFVEVWDMRMESQPLKCINIQDFLAPKLYDLYENDALFDKFEIAINNEGKYPSSLSYLLFESLIFMFVMIFRFSLMD